MTESNEIERSAKVLEMRMKAINEHKQTNKVFIIGFDQPYHFIT